MAVMLPRLLGAVVGLAAGSIYLIVSADSVSAATYLFEYSGQILHIAKVGGGASDEFPPSILDGYEFIVGDTVTGEFVFELTTDQFDGPERAFYADSISTMRFGGISSDPDVNDSHLNINAGPTSSSITSFLNNVYSNISDIFEFELGDPTVTAFNNDQVNLVELMLSDFSDLRFEFGRTFFLPDGLVPSIHIVADIRNLVVTPISPIPLPAAFPLFATALAGMGLLGWRRKRKASASV